MKTLDPDTMFKERTLLLKKMESRLDSCKAYMVEIATSKTELEDVLSIPFEDLATRISGENGNITSIIKARIDGRSREEIENDPNLILPLLWDTEFSMVEYKQIGMNDGELHTLSDVFSTLGEEEKAKEAYSWIYSD